MSSVCFDWNSDGNSRRTLEKFWDCVCISLPFEKQSKGDGISSDVFWFMPVIVLIRILIGILEGL